MGWKGDVARRLGAREERAEGSGGVGIGGRVKGDGALRVMPGRGGARSGEAKPEGNGGCMEVG